ncbi:MAG: permease prefix domain 1-containing protein [Treponema sp.]|jgi:hypothetical protein|nr:permease prefix domain 1-containing protein [Treponema sp.]
MNANEFVNSLFKDYEETPGLRDFMEELRSNLDARTASLIKKGMTEEAALAKAQRELGDISVLAEELSLKRRREVYLDAYLGIRRYLTPRRVAAYVLCGAVFLGGILLALISYLAGGGSFQPYGEMEALTGGLGTLLGPLTLSVMGFTFLGVSQENAVCYPLRPKRALAYALGAGLAAFGIVLSPLTFCAVSRDQAALPPGSWVPPSDPLMSALAVLLPFLITGLGLIAFLFLTEKRRLKPWAAAHFRGETPNPGDPWRDDPGMLQFGLFSGAIWIFALGLFFLLGFVFGFRYSWPVFIFAVAAQLVLQGVMSGTEDEEE